MQNHLGTFRACFATITAAVFLALTLSSCAVTVALPGGGSTTAPITQPPTTGTGTNNGLPETPKPEPTQPKPSEPTTGDDDENGKKPNPTDKNPTEGTDDPNKDPHPQPDPGEPKDPSKSETEPNPPEPGDDMDVPQGYDATWKLDGNTLVLNTYTVPSGSDLNVKLPTGGKYKIGDSLFAGKSQIVSIEIPDDVIEIGNYAFTDTFLSSVEIPESVKIIGDYAFSRTQLQSLTLKGNYTSSQLGKYAFASCDMLENILFTGTATELPEGIFSYTSITSFALPKGLQAIHAQAFDYTYLSELYIPRSVTKIDLSAFDNTAMTINYQGSSENWQEATKGTKLSNPQNVKVEYDCEDSTSDAFSLLSTLFSIFL